MGLNLGINESLEVYDNDVVGEDCLVEFFSSVEELDGLVNLITLLDAKHRNPASLEYLMDAGLLSREAYASVEASQELNKVLDKALGVLKSTIIYDQKLRTRSVAVLRELIASIDKLMKTPTGPNRTKISEDFVKESLSAKKHIAKIANSESFGKLMELLEKKITPEFMRENIAAIRNIAADPDKAVAETEEATKAIRGGMAAVKAEIRGTSINIDDMDGLGKTDEAIERTLLQTRESAIEFIAECRKPTPIVASARAVLGLSVEFKKLDDAVVRKIAVPLGKLCAAMRDMIVWQSKEIFAVVGAMSGLSTSINKYIKE